MSETEQIQGQPHLEPASDDEPVDKAYIIEACFESMRAGNTLNAAALKHGWSPANVWRWIHQDEKLVIKYDQLKIQRSRALIEHALYEMQSAISIEQVKCAERRAKYYLMMAAKLNPKEFSDRMHSPTGAGMLGGGRVSFVLNIGSKHEQSKGELVVIAQPEDGELP